MIHKLTKILSLIISKHAKHNLSLSNTKQEVRGWLVWQERRAIALS